MPRRAGTRGDAAMSKELSVHTRQAAAAIVVDVIGRLTIDSSPHLRPVLHGAIAAAQPAGVVVDLAGVSYLDTSAIATLIEAARLARDRGIKVRVAGLAGAPRLLAEIIELDRIFRSLGSEVEVA
jgi:anti-sigma B factor antagonist